MKKLYLIFIALFVCNISWGQTTTVTIGSGTSTHLFNPINPNFNFSYSQSLFTASELSTGGAIAGQSINAIRFYWGGTGNLNNSNTWVVYLGNTSQSVFSSTTNWIALSALTQVYNGTVSLPGSAGWMTINLTTPYIWDGSSNIVVATDENVSGFTSSPANWRYTSTTPNNRAIFYYNDVTNPNPASPPTASGISYNRNNIQFDFITTASCLFPNSVAATNINYTTANINWNAPSTQPANGYQYEVRTSGTAGSGATGLVSSGTTVAGVTTTSISGLSGSTTYYCYVRSDCGSGDYSAWASGNFTTLSCNIPTSVASSNITSSTATISWTSPASGSPSGYEYEVRTSGAAGSGATGLATSGTTTSPTVSALATGLSGGTTYYIYVRSVCYIGYYSTWTASATFTSAKAEPTNQPTTFAAGTVTTSAIPLTWIAATAGTQAPDGYLIKASSSDFASVLDPVDGTDPTNLTAFTSGLANKKQTSGSSVSTTSFTGMTAGSMYYYKIYSYTNTGTSIDFKTDAVPTLKQATLPNIANSLLFSAPSSTAANISWTAPTGYDAAKHTTLVFVKPTSSITTGSPTNNPTTYTANTILSQGTAYQNDAAAYCVYNGDGNSVAITGLAASTTYHVLIYSVMEEANSNGNYSYSSSATTSGTSQCGAINTFPFIETFVGAVMPPTTCWTKYSGQLTANSTLTSGIGTWNIDDYINVTSPVNKSAKDNVFSTNHYSWLVTPQVDLGTGSTNYKLSFNLGLTSYNSTSSAIQTGTDDIFAVVISTDGGTTWSNANTLKLWNNAGSPNVYNAIPNTGQNVIIDLSSYTGVIKIGFYTESTVTNADNDLFVDDISIEVIPSCSGAIGGTAAVTGSSSFCGANTPVITAIGFSTGTGSTYQWEYSNNNFVSDINDFVGQTTPATLTTGVVSSTTYYRLKVTCNTGTATAYSNIVSVTIKPVPTATASSNSPICSGNSLNLTGTTDIGASYDWTGPNGFTSTLQNPGIANATTAASGDYSYTATLNGCNSAVSTTTVTVNPVPTSVTASSSATTICEGSSIDLTSSAVSNADILINYSEGFETWPPSNWTFINAGSGKQWATSTIFHTGSKSMYYNYNASYAANAWGITPGFSLASGTTYTITFWYKVASATYPEKLKVTVGNATTVIAQSTILWNNNGGSSLTNTNWAQGTTTFTPSSAGTYYLGFNCYSIADMSSLYVDDISINGGVLNPATFSWLSNPSGFTSSNQNPTGVMPSVNTQYTVTAQNIYGCTATANTIVNVDPATVAGTVTATASSILGGQNAELTLSGQTGSITKWQKAFNSGVFADVSPASTANPYSNTPAALGTWSYRAVVQSGVCPSANSVQADVVVNANSTTFNGATDNDWNTTGNWSNGVPNYMYNVIIPVGLTNYPTLVNTTTINNLTIKSDANGTASLITNAALTVSGNTIVERYIANDNKWHFLSSPVVVQDIKPNFAPTVADATFDFFKWDETDAGYIAPWINIRDANGDYVTTGFDNFEIGKAYLVAYSSSYTGNATHEFTGNLNNGDQSISISNSGNTFNLIGNPFASAIDWDASGYTNREDNILLNAAPSVWVWNNTNGNYGTYKSGIAGTLGVSNIIAPHQGFFVQAKTTGSFTIPNSARVHTANNFLKSTPSDLLKLKVSSSMNTYCDEMIVNFNPNSTANDGVAKWFSMITEAPSLYSVINNKNFSINTLAALNADLVVPVSFKAGVNGNYSIKASELASFTNLSNLILKDLQTGITQNLLQNPVYNFASNTTDNANRFQLIFNSTSGISNLSNNPSLIYLTENNIQIQSDNQIDRVEIYNAIGQLVYQSIEKSNRLSVKVSDFISGTYIVRLIANQKIQTQKLIINN